MKETLSAESWKKVTDLFHQALDLEPEHRVQFLATVQSEEPRLRVELESLLSSHSAADDFLEKPVISTDLAGFGHFLKEGRTFAPGDTIEEFTILKVLGTGSFAKVYLARQKSLNREVALKISPNFGEEARTMAHLEHDNIVKVFSETIDARADRRMLCMQFVPGTTLERLLHELTDSPNGTLNGARLLQITDSLSSAAASFSPSALKDRELLSTLDYIEAVVWIGTRLADALAYAHQRGVLHLDVKPGNILISPYGRPLLTDFNVAFSRKTAEQRSKQVVGGTFTYMAPEQHAFFDPEKSDAAIEAIDHHADIFSLGVVLEEMVNVREKYSVPNGTNQARFAELKRTEAEICQVIRTCQNPDIKRRFKSASQLAKALEGCLERRQIARWLPGSGKITEFLRRSPIVGLVILVMLPQMLGSLVNIAYNYSQIVAKLSLSQQEHFEWTVLIYNLLVYPACAVILISIVSPLRRWFRRPVDLVELDVEEARRLRKHIVGLPLRVIVLTTLGWLPGSLFFPLSLHLVEGPVGKEIFAHFMLSFTLSWLIALTYSYLFVQYFGLRILYPALCVGCSDIRKNALSELKIRGSQWRIFHFLAGFIPLVGAFLVVVSGPGQFDNSQYRLFQGLVAFLIALGMLGIVSAILATHGLSQTIFALTGNSPGHEK